MATELFTITDADVENLTQAIKQQPQVPMAAQNTFCNVWPQAKTALELLSSFIVTIPGAGVFARIAIGVVIAAGDAASNAVCK
jgi:hypothetical protein